MNRGAALLALAAGAATAGAQTVNLTGINWYTTDSSMHYTGGYANTYGGDTYSRNLYVSENQSVGSGPLLNSVNMTTLPTRVQINLNTAGNYTFQMYCNDESTASNPFWGLNLFFNGDDLHPNISVWNTVNVAGFQVINPIGTATLNPLTMGTVQSGTGASAFTLGATHIQLTAYSTWSANHYNVDRVDNFTDDGGLGNGTKDDVIQFSLSVTPVPEPSSLLVVGGALLAIARRRRVARES